VASGGTTVNYGILIFNTANPVFASECTAGTALEPAVQCIQPIDLNGSSAQIDIYSLNNGSLFDGLVVYQDRDYNIPGDDVTINGSTSNTQVRGTIYIPAGDVKVNGSGGAMTTDQVIANTFQVNGAPGSTIQVLFDENFLFTFSQAGLVE
jgi:hypothetical protein